MRTLIPYRGIHSSIWLQIFSLYILNNNPNGDAINCTYEFRQSTDNTIIFSIKLQLCFNVSAQSLFQETKICTTSTHFSFATRIVQKQFETLKQSCRFIDIYINPFGFKIMKTPIVNNFSGT